MSNIIHALPIIAVLVFFKYEYTRLIKRQIWVHLEAIHAEDIVIRLERCEYRRDRYHVTYTMSGKRVSKHIDCSLFMRTKWTEE